MKLSIIEAMFIRLVLVFIRFWFCILVLLATVFGVVVLLLVLFTGAENALFAGLGLFVTGVWARGDGVVGGGCACF